MADRREHWQEPATVISTGQVVTNAGARVQLNANLPCMVVSIAAKPANTGNVFLGDVTVTSANGRILAPGASIDIAIDNLNRIYLDVAVNGEGVSYMALS